MPTPYTPSGAAPAPFPWNLVHDGEVYNFDSIQQSGDPAKGLFGKCMDALGFLLGKTLPTTRIHTGVPAFTLAGWVATAGASTFTWSAAGGSHIWFPLRLDHGSTLSSVSIGYTPRSGHGAFPANKPAIMPNFDVIKMTALGVPTTIGTATDTTATDTAYEVAHSLTLSGLSEVIDVGTYTYWLYFQAETSTNAIVGTVLYQPVTVASYP